MTATVTALDYNPFAPDFYTSDPFEVYRWMRDEAPVYYSEPSERTLVVPADRSILSVVEAAGVGVLSSCAEGTCGTCETAVLEGVPDQRDSVLDETERQANDRMMICVSRSRIERLVLDL